MTVLHVVFRVGDSDYVLPATEVLHLDAYEGATRVPGTPPHVAGLVQVRRRVVPVVDLRVRFGLPPTDPTLRSRVLVVQDGERTVGLAVDASREVVRIAPEDFRPPPQVVMESAQGFVKAVAQNKDRLLMLLDVHRVVDGASNLAQVAEEMGHGEQRSGSA